MRRIGSTWVWLLVTALLAALAAIWLLRDRGPEVRGPATFVANAACIVCHADQQARFQGSHHDLAMHAATPETVLGDFNDAQFTHHAVTSRFSRKDGRYLVTTDGPDGTPHEYQVKWVFGWTPLQQYLIELENGRVQCLQVSWDTLGKRWFMVQQEPIPPGDPLHWTGMQFNWNFMCAECHSTNLKRGYDERTNGYATTWSEIDVSCQACHGPGSRHVAWAEGGKPADPTRGLDVLLKGQEGKGQEAKVEVEHCARCHSRRSLLTDDYAYGRDFLDALVPTLLVEPLYYADGQILDEVYEYGSFLQTKKYRRGVRCTDCHDAHSARLKRAGNATCTYCHQEQPPADYPTIRRKAYDVPEHLRHAAGTPGTACVDCHLPTTTYMGVDARRDHSFRVPRPDLSVRVGVPNACNRCHTDKSPQWALEATQRLYPEFATGRMQAPHFADAFAAARRGDPQAAGLLKKVIEDPESAGIVRATAVVYLSEAGPRGGLAAIVKALGDPDGLVRGTAAAALGDLLAGREKPPDVAALVKALSAVLDDPVRYVRSRAARALVPAAQGLEPARRGAYAAALAEWTAEQVCQLDRPNAHLNLAVVDEVHGDDAHAEQRYRRALELDPNSQPVRLNYAMLLNRRGRNEEAEAQLTAAVTHFPEDGQAWYSLGLLQAERQRLDAAVVSLQRTVALLPGHLRARYNLGLALVGIGRTSEAADVLDAALALAPGDVDMMLAVAGLALQRQDWARAESLLKILIEIAPEQPGVAELDRRLREARGR